MLLLARFLNPQSNCETSSNRAFKSTLTGGLSYKFSRFLEDPQHCGGYNVIDTDVEDGIYLVSDLKNGSRIGVRTAFSTDRKVILVTYRRSADNGQNTDN